MSEGNILEFIKPKPKDTGDELKEPAKTLQFPEKAGERLSYENQAKVESTATNLGEDLVGHPIGVLGGFLDTAVDQLDPKLLKKLLEGGAYGLLQQAVPSLASRPERDEARDEYLVEAYKYLEGAVSDRRQSGTPLFIPTKPSEIDSTGSLNFGDALSAIEGVPDNDLKSKYIEANAQRIAAGVLGIADGARHPMIEERIQKDRNFLITTLGFRKRFPDRKSFSSDKHPYLRIIK